MSKMHLQSVVQVRWNSDFALGQGIDAVTGARKASALHTFSIPSDQIGEDPERESGVRSITSLSEIFNEGHEGIAANVNVGLPVKLGMSVGRTTLSGFSTSSSIVEYYIKGKYSFEQANDKSLTFTRHALSLLDNPKLFRECYGDYFICGYQKQYRLHAIVSYKSEKTSNESSLEVSAGLDTGAYGGLNGTFKRKGKDNRSQTVESVLYITAGYSPSATTDSIATIKAGITDDLVEKIIDSVQEVNFKGVRQIALLRHYSTLYPEKLSRSMNLSNSIIPGLVGDLQTIISELQEMDRCCLKLDINLYHPAVNAVAEEVRKAIAFFKKNRSAFIRDYTGRLKAMGDLKSLETLVKEKIKQSTYIRNELNKRRRSPKGVVEDSNAYARWSYGITGREKIGTERVDGREVKKVQIYSNLVGKEVLLIYNEPRSVNLKIWDQGPRYMEFEAEGKTRIGGPRGDSSTFYPYPMTYAGVTIIGFTVSFDNSEGKKVQFDVKDGGLLCGGLKIRISEIPRGCECHCRVTYLDYPADYYGCRAGVLHAR